MKLITIPEFLAKQTLEELELSLEAGGSCDHSVGICACQLINCIKSMKEWLNEDESIKWNNTEEGKGDLE